MRSTCGAALCVVDLPLAHAVGRATRSARDPLDTTLLEDPADVAASLELSAEVAMYRARPDVGHGLRSVLHRS